MMSNFTENLFIQTLVQTIHVSLLGKHRPSKQGWRGRLKRAGVEPPPPLKWADNWALFMLAKRMLSVNLHLVVGDDVAFFGSCVCI